MKPQKRTLQAWEQEQFDKIEGVEFRSRLAGQAMQGLIASNLYDRVMAARKKRRSPKNAFSTPDEPVTSFVAMLAVEYADALIKRLKL